MLGDVSTILGDRGIFLPLTRRLHPLICNYVSRVVYDGRLSSDNPAARQRLLLSWSHPALAPAGLRFAAIAHAGTLRRKQRLAIFAELDVSGGSMSEAAAAAA